LTNPGFDDKIGKMSEQRKNDLFRRIHPELDSKFLKQHPQKAESIINSLTLQEQLELVLERRGRERMALILLSRKSQSLVRLLPEEELYFTLKEIGEEDSLPLLAMADLRQLNYIFDLEFWEEQTLSPERYFRWLDLLKQADEDRLREWLKKADPELLLTILQKAVRVYVPEPDNLGAEPWRNKELFTMDDQYYFEIIDERFQVIAERILAHLRDLEQDKFYALMDEVRLQVATENEDVASRVRQGRLEDHGFYDFDEAIKIYQALSPEKLKALEKNPERPGTEGAPAARLAMTLAQKLPYFLARGLQELSGAEIEDFHHQFARLCNKVMVADALDLTRLESLSVAVEKVYGYLEIGLESWSLGQFGKAVELLKRQWLEHIFQAGFSQVLTRSRRAQRLKQEQWFKELKEPFYLFGDPDGKIIKALALPRPKFYTGQKPEETAEFKSLEELKTVEQALDRAEIGAHLVLDILHLDLAGLKELIELYPFELNFKVMLATSLVNGVVRGEPLVKSVSVEQVSRFIHQSMRPSEPRREIYPNLKQEFTDWFERMAEGKVKSLETVRELVKSALASIEDELGLVQDTRNLNPRYLSSIIIEPGQTKTP